MIPENKRRFISPPLRRRPILSILPNLLVILKKSRNPTYKFKVVRKILRVFILNFNLYIDELNIM